MTEWLPVRHIARRFGMTAGRVRSIVRCNPGIGRRADPLDRRVLVVNLEDFRRVALRARRGR